MLLRRGKPHRGQQLNRTYVELKCEVSELLYEYDIQLNRTYVELKCLTGSVNSTTLSIN